MARYMKIMLIIAAVAMIMALPVTANYASSQEISKSATSAAMGTTGMAGNITGNDTMGTTGMAGNITGNDTMGIIGAAGQKVSIGLVAENNRFNTTTISVPAEANVTMNFNNMDSGVAHNFAAYTDSSASESIFIGQVITGPRTITYTFDAPEMPGTYFFRCDVHPATMTGQLIVR